MNILLTTDFSYGSLKASRYIINLFGVKNHKYVLLNSANVKYAGATFYQEFLADVDAYNEAELVKVSEELKSEFEGLTIKTHAEIGSLITAIDRHNKQGDYSLIGLGANGSSNIYEKLIGSTALDVLDHCQLPITIVPVVAQIEQPKKLMVAIAKNFELTKERFIQLLSQLDKQPETLFLYHIGEQVENAIESLQKDLNSHFPAMNVIVSTNATTGAAIESQILEFATENEVDLLFTSPKDHNLIQRLFQHSITDQIIERTHIPMIALKH